MEFAQASVWAPSARRGGGVFTSLRGREDANGAATAMLRRMHEPSPIEEVPLQAADGHAFLLRRASPAAARAGLLFLPALGVPAHKYDPWLQALAGLGVAGAVPEWRGIGSSSWRARRGRDWGYGALLGLDLRAVLDAMDDGSAWHFGGHSLGGQFAAMLAALHPQRCRGLVLVATGVPDHRLYRGTKRLGIAAFAHALPLLTRLVGHYPGEALGFAGREAGGVMRDWAATVRTARYRDYGQGAPLDARLAALRLPALGVSFERDWLVPAASLQALFDKLGGGPRRVERFDDARLGVVADHFRWLRSPGAVARAVAQALPLSP